jgi:hypothetical protein
MGAGRSDWRLRLQRGAGQCGGAGAPNSLLARPPPAPLPRLLPPGPGRCGGGGMPGAQSRGPAGAATPPGTGAGVPPRGGGGGRPDQSGPGESGAGSRWRPPRGRGRARCVPAAGQPRGGCPKGGCWPRGRQRRHHRRGAHGRAALARAPLGSMGACRWVCPAVRGLRRGCGRPCHTGTRAVQQCSGRPAVLWACRARRLARPRCRRPFLRRAAAPNASPRRSVGPHSGARARARAAAARRRNARRAAPVLAPARPDSRPACTPRSSSWRVYPLVWEWRWGCDGWLDRGRPPRRHGVNWGRPARRPDPPRRQGRQVRARAHLSRAACCAGAPPGHPATASSRPRHAAQFRRPTPTPCRRAYRRLRRGAGRGPFLRPHAPRSRPGTTPARSSPQTPSSRPPRRCRSARPRAWCTAAAAAPPCA